MSKTKTRIGILGGSGYGGSELLRILLQHPAVQIGLVTANEHAGKAVTDIHRNLLGLTDLQFSRLPENLQTLEELTCVFLALPHGQAMEIVPRLPRGVKVVDLSGDFRLRETQEFEKYYGREHLAMEKQNQFVYGLTELHRDHIARSDFVANPGCFATATLLGLAPLVANNLIADRVVVDAKTGSSGSGAKPATNTHHPQRMNALYAYKPFKHQHVPEIEQELRTLGDWTSDLVFMTHSVPLSRGIFASIYVETKQAISSDEVHSLFADCYRDCHFVRLVKDSPDINWVKTTNFCDIGVFTRGNQMVVFSALDNLVKGAAGQAVQNMNLMLGFEETTGLMQIGTNP